MTQNDIIKFIEASVKKMEKSLPSAQKDIFNSIQDELKRLDTVNGKIKTTVKNLSIVNSIKNKLNRLILNETYLSDVKDFAAAFSELTKMQNQYWQSVESTFKPRPLLKAIRVQAITDTVEALSGAGIGGAIADSINQVLRTNVTTGGSYASLTEQLRNLVLESETPGVLQRYVRQIATDSINQYSAQYNQIVGSDLGFEWFSYRGSDIMTTRPFCDAMTDRRYFHISSIPLLLQAKNEDGTPLQYLKDGAKTNVPIYSKTGLPGGMIPGTDGSNFQIRRGGFNCGHQVGYVSEELVKRQAPELYQMIINSAPYKAYQRLTN